MNLYIIPPHLSSHHEPLQPLQSRYDLGIVREVYLPPLKSLLLTSGVQSIRATHSTWLVHYFVSREGLDKPRDWYLLETLVERQRYDKPIE